MTTTHLISNQTQTETPILATLIRMLFVSTKASLHIGALIGVFALINAVPSYLVYAIIEPHKDASSYSAGILVFTVFVTFFLFGSILIRAITYYTKQLWRCIK